MAAVQAAYHTHQAAAPDEIPREAYAQMPGGERLYAQARAGNRGKTLLHLQGRGLWFFFDGDGRLAEIRFDRPFAGSVAGIRLGDTQAQVRANLGRPLDLPGSRGLIPQSFYDVRPGLRAHYLFGLRDGVAAMFLMPSHGLPPPRPAVPAAAPDESKAAPPSASPAAAALAAPVQTLWKDGRGWSWDDRAVTVQADLGGGLTAMDRGAAPGGDGALHLAADAPCPQGCDADVLRLVLPAAVDVAAYLPKGHIRFDASLAQPMIGTLVVWYGQGKPCNHVSVPLGALRVGAFSHVNISLSAFHHSCGQNPAVTVPFHLTLKQVHYKAGPVLALKSIRWTPD
ncbi:MAG TPA: hypothetical protein VNZ67_04750 [bacterium]|nr:hypothetical protein [bacterium]